MTATLPSSTKSTGDLISTVISKAGLGEPALAMGGRLPLTFANDTRVQLRPCRLRPLRTGHRPSGCNCVLPAPLCCQGRGPVAFEGAPALVAVKVVRPVGRPTLTVPARRRGGLAAEAAWGTKVDRCGCTV